MDLRQLEIFIKVWAARHRPGGAGSARQPALRVGDFGGLLFAVDGACAAMVREGFARASEPVWEIGEVTVEPRLALI